MNFFKRLTDTLLKLTYGKSALDTLEVGEETSLAPARLDKGKKQFTIEMVARRDR